MEGTTIMVSKKEPHLGQPRESGKISWKKQPGQVQIDGSE